MTFSMRPYHPGSDLPHLFALTRLNNQQAAPTYLHAGDVLWQLFQNTVFEPERHVRLWEDARGQIMAFAWFEEPDGVVWCIHPQARGMVEPAIVAWAAQQIDSDAPGADGHLWMRVSGSDTATLETLPALGFLEDERHARKMQHLFASMPAVPSAPPGVALRAVAGEEEWPARVELHRAVWHPSCVTLEAYRRLRATPGFRPELDLVAVADDGVLAAYCLCWYDPDTRIGLFEPVGTHPAYRGRGLGKAVVREGLRRLRAAGATAAWVTAVDSNLPAGKLYESAGFTTAAYEYLYRKPL